MRYDTTAVLKAGVRTAHGFNKVWSQPVAVTDEHSGSSYGQPAILALPSKADGGEIAELMDYADVESVEVPQRYSRILYDGTGPNDYRPVVDYFRRLEAFGVKLTGVIPGWYDAPGEVGK